MISSGGGQMAMEGGMEGAHMLKSAGNLANYVLLGDTLAYGTLPGTVS
jgi:hypothetical protein